MKTVAPLSVHPLYSGRFWEPVLTWGCVVALTVGHVYPAGPAGLGVCSIHATACTSRMFDSKSRICAKCRVCHIPEL